MDVLAVTDVVRFTHILAVAIGLGAAFMADLQAMTHITRPIDKALLSTLHICHRLVWAALIVMWISGVGLIYIRTGFELANFSPKLFSKLTTVSVLTANAVLIGAIAMPMMRLSEGRIMLHLPMIRLLPLAALGAISTASWLLALAMGVSKVLAASDWPTFEQLLPGTYTAAVLGVTVLMLTLRQITRSPVSVTA